MEDSTSIDDLPNPAFGGGGGVVQPGAAAVVIPPAQQMQQQMQYQPLPVPPPPAAAQQQQQIDPKYMNYIINGIQQTGGSTLGTLPSRDIPMNTLEIQQDDHIRANYIPQPPKAAVASDFVEEYERRHKNTPPKEKRVTFASAPAPLFEDFYFPILAAILFFIFQMPAFSHIMFKYLKFLYNADGNITNAGILFKSIVFGAILSAGVYSGIFTFATPL